MKHDIQNREDITLLVSEFYKKVRQDAVLGPFFNDTITDWEHHLNHLTTFWETSLFMTKKLTHKYYGNPCKWLICVIKREIIIPVWKSL